MTECKIPQKYFFFFSALALAIGVIYLYYFQGAISLIQNDSIGYINFGASRTIGYPTFLWIIHKIFGNYTWLPIIQMSIHFVATIFLSLTFYQLTRRWTLSFLLFTLQVLNLEWVKYDFMILTESLSGSILLCILSFIIRFYLYARTKDLIGLAAMVGLCILMRPVAYALVPVLGFLAYLVWPQLKTRVWALIVPLLIVLAMGILVQRYKNGFWDTESFVGHNLLGKAGIIVDSTVPSRHPASIQELSTMVEPIRNVLAQAPTWQMEYILATPYYDYMRFTYAANSKQETPKASDQYWKEIAVDIIKARPVLYARDVFINYFALWLLWDFKTSGEALILETLTQKLYPLPVFKEFPFPPRTTEAAKTWRQFAPFMRAGLIVSMVTSFLIIGYTLWRRWHNQNLDAHLQVAFTAALIVNGHYGLTALLQAGLARYAVFAWPAIGVMMLSVMDFYWKKYKK